MTGISKRFETSIFFLILIAMGITAGWALRECTLTGAGLINDSTAYIAGARSILQGTGYSEIWLDPGGSPITHYPPLFSIALTLIGLMGIDPLRGARILNIFLFCINTGLIGTLGWKMTSSRVWGLVLALIFSTNGVLLTVHSYAISEPLFLFFCMASFILATIHFETQSGWLALLAGISVGWATLTRYVGLPLLLTLAVTFIVFHVKWRSRLTNLVIFLAGSIPWLFAWFLRNKLLSNLIADRGIGWTPIPTGNIKDGIINFGNWLFPIGDISLKAPGVIILLLILLGIGLLAWIIFKGTQYFIKPTETQRPNLLAFIVGLFILVYFGSLITSMIMFDPTTKFQDRILSPIYISLLILFISVVSWVWQHENKFLRAISIFMVSIVILASWINLFHVFSQLREDGQGYASKRYQTSTITNYIRPLPNSIKIYTNSPPAIYSSTGRASRIIFLDLGPSQPGLRDYYARINDEVRDGQAILVLYEVPNDSVLQETYDLLTYGLNPARRNGRDVIFTSHPQ